jgi:hypothetical protein
MRAGLPTLAVVIITAWAGPALSQQQKVHFRDIREILGSPIATRRLYVDPPIVREAQQTLADGQGPAPPDASLGRPLARLALDAESLRKAILIETGTVVAMASPLVEFALGSRVVRMPIVETAIDADLDAVHYTLVQPSSTNYARLTIARSGPEIVGTVFLDDDEYRILPERDGYQLVYPVTGFDREFRRSIPPDLRTRAGMLEARHLQMAWYAEHQPRRFDTRVDGRLYSYSAPLRGGGAGIGAIDIWGAMQATEAGDIGTDLAALARSIESWLSELEHLTLINDPIEVVVERTQLAPIYESRSDEATIHFRQIIDGIPLSNDARLTIDRSGTVLEFSGVLLQLDAAERPPTLAIERAEAETLARTSAIDAHAVAWPLSGAQGELIYDSPVNAVLSVQPIWRIQFGTTCLLRYRVDIDAMTGEILRNIEYVGAVSFLPSRDEIRRRCADQAPR